MAARKIDGWWYADFRVHGIRYRKRSPQNTAPGARAYESFLRGEIALHASLDHLEPTNRPERKTVPTFAEFAERWMRDYVAVNNKPSEQRAKAFALRLHLKPAFGSSPIDQISTQEIERLKGTLIGKGIAPKSVNNYLAILRKCLSTAVDWDELSVAPRTKALRCAPPPFRFLTEEEVRRLLGVTAPDSLLFALILTAARTGLRSCELFALQWEDVDLGTRQACVRQAIVRGHLGATKTHQIRYAYLSTRCAVPMAVAVAGTWEARGHATTQTLPGDARRALSSPRRSPGP